MSSAETAHFSALPVRLWQRRRRRGARAARRAGRAASATPAGGCPAGSPCAGTAGGVVNAGSGGRMRGMRGDGLGQLLRGGAGLFLPGGGGAVVDQRAHGELGEPAVDAGPHLVGGDQPDALGQAGEAVGVLLVGPALGQRGVEQGADRLGVRALRAARR